MLLQKDCEGCVLSVSAQYSTASAMCEWFWNNPGTCCSQRKDFAQRSPSKIGNQSWPLIQFYSPFAFFSRTVKDKKKGRSLFVLYVP